MILCSIGRTTIFPLLGTLNEVLWLHQILTGLHFIRIQSAFGSSLPLGYTAIVLAPEIILDLFFFSVPRVWRKLPFLLYRFSALTFGFLHCAASKFIMCLIGILAMCLRPLHSPVLLCSSQINKKCLLVCLLLSAYYSPQCFDISLALCLGGLLPLRVFVSSEWKDCWHFCFDFQRFCLSHISSHSE